MVSGGLLVAALALVADLLLALAQRYIVSRGISGRARRRGKGSRGPDSRSAALTEDRLGGRMTSSPVSCTDPGTPSGKTRREHEDQACRSRRGRDGLHDGVSGVLSSVGLGLQG